MNVPKRALLLLALASTPGQAEPVTFHVYPPGAKIYVRGSSKGNESYAGVANTPIEIPSALYNASNYEVVIRHPDGHHIEKVERPVFRSAQWPPNGEIQLQPGSGLQEALDLIRYPRKRSAVFLALLLGGAAFLTTRLLSTRKHLQHKEADAERARLRAAQEARKQEEERAFADAERKLAEQEKKKALQQQSAVQLREEAIRKNQGKDRWIGANLGDYTPLQLLGRGASGRVYLGVRTTEEDSKPPKIAIKIIETDGGMADALKKRFLSEAEVGKAFQHPNIVRYYGKGELPEAIYLFLELVEGARTIKDLPLPQTVQQVSTLLRPIAEALDYMHEKGCFHRDLKPENIMLTPDGTPKIADLGLAKNPMASQLTRTSEGFGTLAYVAPEQLMDFKSADGRADQYSFGCMVYELLANQLPFPITDPNALIMAHLQQTPPPIPAIGDRANAALQKMLAKDKEARFPKLVDAINALS
jgi:hypothetical protein